MRLFAPALLAMTLALTQMACSTAPKSAEHWSDETLVDGLLAASGTFDGIDGLSSAFEAAVNNPQEGRGPAQLDESTRKFLGDSFKEAFEPGRLKASIKTRTNAGLSRAEKVKLMNWYYSPIGEKTLLLDRKSQTYEFQQGFQAWLEQIEKDEVKLDPNTIEFAKRCVVYSGAVDMAVEVTAASSLGMVRGMNASFPAEKRLSELKLTEMESTVKEQLTDRLAPVLVLAFYYTYQSLAPAEREMFLQHLQDPASVKFSKVVVRAISETLKVASAEVGGKISRHVASLPAKED